jgi:hypothetical protein
MPDTPLPSLTQEELLTLFEAARWAPSTYNEQERALDVRCWMVLVLGAGAQCANSGSGGFCPISYVTDPLARAFASAVTTRILREQG